MPGVSSTSALSSALDLYATVLSRAGVLPCFLMNGQELATAAKYDTNTKFIVVNNNMYGSIRTHQERNFPERPKS